MAFKDNIGMTEELKVEMVTSQESIIIDPIDAEGDIVVRLVGRSNHHIATHGQTLSEALRRLADVLDELK
jgi:hypothetical protein